MLEVFVYSVIILAGYQGFVLVRRWGRAYRLHALMLGADSVVALLAASLMSQEGSERTGELLGTVAVLAYVFLVMVPALLRSLAQQALMRDRIGLALRLLKFREYLQPGLPSQRERETVQTIAQVRAGMADQALTALNAERRAIEEPILRRALDERIVLTLLYARRLPDAAAHFERTLDAVAGPTSAKLLVELVRAYGELGDFDGAARVLGRLEESLGTSEPPVLLLLYRARLSFLAPLGRVAEVEAMLSPPGAMGDMSAAARSYWIGVAKLSRGDREGARVLLAEAVKRAGRDQRARELAETALARVDRAPFEIVSLSGETLALADKIGQLVAAPSAEARMANRFRRVARGAAPVTLSLIAVNVLVAVAVRLLLGPSEEDAVLLRAGANFKPAVAAGEWFRLLTSTVLHAGPVHLLVNMLGLWVLGRFVEPVFGRVRFFAIYLLAGWAGAGASFALGRGVLSVGASGALMGLLGAAIIDLVLHRRAYPEGWRRSILEVLLVVAIVQLVIDLQVEMIDQSAHLGGFLSGGLLGALISPRGRPGSTRAIRMVAALLVVVSVVGLGHASWGLSRKLWPGRWERWAAEGVSIEVPASWTPLDQGTLIAPEIGSGATISLGVGSVEEIQAALKDTLPSAREATDLAAPPGWRAFQDTHEVRTPQETRSFFIFFFAQEGTLRSPIIILRVPVAGAPAMRAILPRLLASASVVLGA
ncbi:MAG: rhomboid family intramembrane serine protease [Deltaproteobacteria bacterium]|nr:rhomboid family intramembrane serine protease [Deltaproteobacteria bacterium]